jgi:hypothetical protein
MIRYTYYVVLQISMYLYHLFGANPNTVLFFNVIKRQFVQKYFFFFFER